MYTQDFLRFISMCFVNYFFFLVSRLVILRVKYFFSRSEFSSQLFSKEMIFLRLGRWAMRVSFGLQVQLLIKGFAQEDIFYVSVSRFRLGILGVQVWGLRLSLFFKMLVFDFEIIYLFFKGKGYFTEWRYLINFLSFSVFSTGVFIRVMMRMLVITQGEFVSWMSIFERGESRGFMLNGMIYMVRFVGLVRGNC